jgi:hypothetical protein
MLSLCDDELGQIISFLKNNSVCDFALLCKRLNQVTSSHLKKENPVTLTKPWTFQKALRLRKEILLETKSDARQLLPLLKKKGDIVKLSSTLRTKVRTRPPMHVEYLFDILSLPTSGQVVLPSIEVPEEALYPILLPISNRLFSCVVGHDLKHLVIQGLLYNNDDLHFVLHHAVNIETLSFDSGYEANSQNCLVKNCTVHPDNISRNILPVL